MAKRTVLGVDQIDLFADIFGDEKVESKKPTFALQKSETEKIDSCEAADTCSGDEDLPDFAQMEQQLDGQTPANPKPEAKKVETKKFEEIDRDWVVCYAGNQIKVAQRGLKLEQIRKMLEKDFPELSKERTEMVFDEKKGIIIPIVKGAKKGATLDYSPTKSFHLTKESVISSEKPINVLAASDGYYEIRRNDLGVICVKKESAPELPTCREGFSFGLKPVPVELLYQIISFFRWICLEGGEQEAMVQLYWDRQRDEYFIVVPEQSVTKTMVSTSDLGTFDTEMIEADGKYLPAYVQVAQIHSHNTMRAFFSEQDNRCEQGSMLYMVIGELDRFFPSIRCRVGAAGKYLEVPVESIFELPFTEVFPVEWIDKVNPIGKGEATC